MTEPPPPPRLMDRVRGAIRARHYSRRTEDAYARWIRRFIFFHGTRHPAAMGREEVNAFLTDLAVKGRVSASTQGQALSALVFLYRHVLDDPLPWLDDLVRARRTRRLPVVFTRQEVQAVLGGMRGTPRLVASVLYGGGLRLLEALRLRVKDVDFAGGLLVVREGKGSKDRRTLLPEGLKASLREQIGQVRRIHERDLIRTIQELLGHADVRTTMIYTHVLQQVGRRGVRSPFDQLETGGGSP